MTAQEQLAAVIAEHPWYVSPSPAPRGYCLGCLVKPIPVGGTMNWAEFATFSEYAAHLAAAISETAELALGPGDRCAALRIAHDLAAQDEPGAVQLIMAGIKAERERAQAGITTPWTGGAS